VVAGLAAVVARNGARARSAARVVMRWRPPPVAGGRPRFHCRWTYAELATVDKRSLGPNWLDVRVERAEADARLGAVAEQHARVVGAVGSSPFVAGTHRRYGLTSVIGTDSNWSATVGLSFTKRGCPFARFVR